jgi:predicted patatin/cPLA2 family phospholipase
MQVPKYLVISPNDSDAQKAAKKKKLHSLKYKQVQKEKEDEVKKRQSQWQNFQKKIKGKETVLNSLAKSPASSVAPQPTTNTTSVTKRMYYRTKTTANDFKDV